MTGTPAGSSLPATMPTLLELQARELLESLEQRQRETAEHRSAQASRVYIRGDPRARCPRLAGKGRQQAPFAARP